MKGSILSVILFFSFILHCIGQDYSRTTNVSYNYFSRPGFVNITELTAAPGIENICHNNSWYYFGATNIFGYQLTRNVNCGAGIGFYYYDYSKYFPVFADLRYTTYLPFANPFFYVDGGLLVDAADPVAGTKVFFNPGLGLSRSITPKIETNLGAGINVQMGNEVKRATFINFKLGITFRKYAMRLYKPPERVKGLVYE